MVTLAIRPFERRDLDALYEVALATGADGHDASHLYEDGKLPGHLYAAPYALLEPGLALVVEDGVGVAGYAVGVPDTGHWLRMLEREWWPALRTSHPDPSEGTWSEWSADQLCASTIHHPAAPPADIVTTCPAHLHLNLLPRLQGQGVGHRLFAEWMKRATERGVKAAHVAVGAANRRGQAFWLRQGFEPLPHVGSSGVMWMGRIAR